MVCSDGVCICVFLCAFHMRVYYVGFRCAVHMMCHMCFPMVVHMLCPMYFLCVFPMLFSYARCICVCYCLMCFNMFLFMLCSCVFFLRGFLCVFLCVFMILFHLCFPMFCPMCFSHVSGVPMCWSMFFFSMLFSYVFS